MSTDHVERVTKPATWTSLLVFSAGAFTTFLTAWLVMLAQGTQ